MNYYIQGNKEKAEQIKAMFGKLGYRCANDFNYQSERTLYFTFDGEVKSATCESYKSIIKTHPDYKELELPVEPCFKVGDMIRLRGGSIGEHIIEVNCYEQYYLLAREGCKQGTIRVHFSIQDQYELVKPQTNAKIGDLVYCDGVLGRVTNVNEEQQEVTIGGDWTVYLGDGLITFRKANQQDIDNVLKGGEQ